MLCYNYFGDNMKVIIVDDNNKKRPNKEEIEYRLNLFL